MRPTTLAALFGLLVAGALLSAAAFKLPLKAPYMDAAADAYFETAITKAGLAYATTRVINAAVSVLQNTEIELQPLGFGMSLAAGQVLDPINDMTERLSDVLVMAIVSLGVQKLAYEISVVIAPPLLGALLLGLSLLLFAARPATRGVRYRQILLRLIVVVIAARFFLPLAAMANTLLNEYFFVDQIAAATEQLQLNTATLHQTKLSPPTDDGLLDKIGTMTTKLAEWSNSVKTLLSQATDIIQSLLRLTYLYVGLFLIQVILLPLLLFWIFVRMINIGN